MDLPFKTEYAKSGRSSCKGCKSSIDQGTLRLAVMIQSPKFDGKMPNWYHQTCFFLKQRPKTVDDIEKFETLRLEDQQKIKEQINTCGAIVPDKKGKKRGADTAAKKNALKDFRIEYSKSSRAVCRGCEQKIMKDEIRISKKDFDTDVGKKYGGQDMWHHLACFAKLRSELGYFESADKLPGFQGLNKDDQKDAKTQIAAIKQEDLPDVKKMKVDPEQEAKDKLFKDQNTLFYKNRDKLQDLQKKELVEFLEFAGQGIPSGTDRLLDRLADYMTFGITLPCAVCKGQLVYSREGYKCHGDLTEWTKCTNIVKEPKRAALPIPPELKQAYPFLKKYKYVPTTRVIKDFNPTNSVKKMDEVDAPPKVQREKPPLYEMEFVLINFGSNHKAELKDKIVKMGGKVVTKIQKSVMAVIASQETVDKMGSRIQEAESAQVHVVDESLVHEAPDNVGKIPDLVIKKSICNWGSDPSKRLPAEPSSSYKSLAKSRSQYTSKMPSKVKLKVVGGVAVDPDSGLEERAHVYQRGNEKYTVVLGITDVVNNRNSYYKLQLLEANKGGSYWVFRAWGRIGTTIGGTKLESFDTLHDAKKKFEEMYEEKSGNYWEHREHFVKVPGKLYPIDVDYNEDSPEEKLDIVESESNLKKPVQDLMKLIFDVKQMKNLMLEFELDMEKMPLGKLSKKQIQSAFKVLNELQHLIDGNETVEARFIDATNRFYTFIPHSFGIENPPLIKDKETVQKKLEMLDSLMELEVAYNLMKSSGSEHTVDSYYGQLKTDIDVLERTSEEFGLIEKYIQNTHAKTHSNYKLEIEDVYTVKRHGEEKRFKPFKKLPNHKLLWHGSRVTNFAGILSQGLRIAPPEAPVTGYMFGKGIYFADMVSKSANYCSTSVNQSTGLLLLCDVALGEMYERYHADYIEKLPKGKHSCLGLGRTEPDPKNSKTINGIEIPLGKGITVPGREESSLLYNEYIVYDVAQVNVKYMLKLNFKYKF
ncbi:unnamed protein product [Brassicogethes aeneus]|uniref:Poly [ADP-ribose] polymerase n=1 Tax=Brassicogethes aeneus TaxID=1431903 RepID=A0A9P0AQX7_BRAAE|nr:unnamed protein product [Brassicogethes aeneus]